MIDFVDIREAYFHAKATRDVYIELPEEDREEGMCDKLNKTLYGTRDAARNWEAACTEFMTGVGFETGEASPCKFHHKEKTSGHLYTEMISLC